MHSFRRRTPLHSMTLRARRRRRARIMAAITALAILAVLAGFIYLIRAPFLRIQTVEVTGTDPHSAAEIAAFTSEQLAGNHRWYIPRNHVWEYARLDLKRGILTAFPRLASAEPRLQSFTALTIRVSERLPKAIWCAEASIAEEMQPCRFLDQYGAAYASAASTSASAYITYYGILDTNKVPPQFLSPQEFRALAVFIDALVEASGGGPARSASVDSYGTVTVGMQSFAVRFALDDVVKRAGVLLNRLEIALESPPFKTHKLSKFEYLDLRFGDSLYYKLKGEEAVGASTTAQ